MPSDTITSPSDGLPDTGRRADFGASTFELTSWESLDRIREQPVGRICILEHGVPIAFPVNYRVAGDPPECRIVMRTAPATAVGRYDGSASLEVDDIDLGSGRAWSVIVRGQLRPMLGEDPPADPRPLVTAGRTRWMMLTADVISGRRFVVRRGRDEFTVDWQSEPS